MGTLKWSEFSGCEAGPDSPATIQCLEAVLYNIIFALVSLAGLALFIMILIGGYTYLTAGDNAEQAQNARKTIFWAISRIVLMIFSYIILRAIYWFTGVDVLKFDIPYFPS